MSTKRITAILLVCVLIFGCTSGKNIEQNEVLAICHSEYSKLNKTIRNKATPVRFTVKLGGTLLPKHEYNKEKQEASELNKLAPQIIDKIYKKEKLTEEEIASVAPLLFSAGNEYLEVGSRARFTVWPDSEKIIFTTTDGKFDIQINLVFTPKKKPIDIKKLAKNISEQYNRLR